MGASKNLFTSESEKQAIENQESAISNKVAEAKPTPRQILIEKLKKKEVRLSYSSLKKLDSPVNFMSYFLDKKEQKSKSQNLGSLIDCKVLTPDVFDKNFAVVDAVPTTDLQVRFCNEVLKLIEDSKKDSENNETVIKTIDDVFDLAYSNCYSKGNSTSVDHLKPYIQALSSNKEIVSSELNNKADLIAKNLLEQQDIVDELEQIEETQKVIEFEYMGWKFKSALDTFSPKTFHDLKFATDCAPDKFEYDIRKYSYDIQFGLYCIGLEVLGLARNPEFKFIVFDEKFNYAILPVDSSYISFAKRKVEFLIMCLDKMIAENAFNKSYNFFKSKSIIYKPNWVKGMDHDIFTDEDDL